MSHQVQFVFEKWFQVFSFLLEKQVKGDKNKPEPIVLQYAKTKQNDRPQNFNDDFLNPLGIGFDDDNGLERLDVLTPVYPPKNSSANVQGWSFLAVFNEIKKANGIIRTKNVSQLQKQYPACPPNPCTLWESIFSSQPISQLSEIRYVLLITVLSSDPVFYGFFQSRIKNLRERIENAYISLRNEQEDLLKENVLRDEQRRYFKK